MSPLTAPEGRAFIRFPLTEPSIALAAEHLEGERGAPGAVGPSENETQAQMEEVRMADTNPAQIFEGIGNRLKANPEKAKAINAVYQFNITGDQGGTWTVDCANAEAKSGAATNPGCTITMGDKDFIDLVQGKLNGQMAFMSGKLKVAGNMALAMKLQQVLGG